MFDDDLINEKLPIKNGGMLSKINEMNYSFKYYGNQVGLIDKKLCYKGNLTNISNLCWEYLCDIYESNQNNISILHIMEAHSPYVCGDHKNKPIEFSLYCYNHGNKNISPKQQREESLRYLDKQLEYYFKFINKNTSFIITSDHGSFVDYDKNSKNDNFWDDDIIKIPYIILNYDYILFKEDNRLISHLDTSKIICNLVKKKNPFEEIEKRTTIEVNRDFTYAKHQIEKNVEFNKAYLGRAFKCVRTKYDKYIIYYNGEEEFYFLPDEDNNLINDIRYKTRIEEIKKHVNKEFYDFSGERFKYAREVFEIK